ncbi:hypothetical protein LAUMK191_01256 [Mycobacterium attenuatum]|uniref:Transposase IS204/IS1001/IS1096/IS1165 DDE domain-containing protein n=1 Tax=Mycobacterium attenuatum TaxID=2341086 RepID=A0A498PV80_9MYCO|nr:hypothetical protein LAUMK136_01256 [Mycobacterium attenuatum]VBA48686.1 hypothetical protein LAUMK191_01256 [Mycobacterium attenuatum]
MTPVCDKTGSARLLDVVEGRSKKAFQQWLADRPKDWRDHVEGVAMEGFSGFKTATVEELPDVATVMAPFHVVRLAGNALDEWRRGAQLATHGHRGRKTDPLYACRRTLQTGADLLTDKQRPGWQPYSLSTSMPRLKPPGRSTKVGRRRQGRCLSGQAMRGTA